METNCFLALCINGSYTDSFLVGGECYLIINSLTVGILPPAVDALEQQFVRVYSIPDELMERENFILDEKHLVFRFKFLEKLPLCYPAAPLSRFQLIFREDHLNSALQRIHDRREYVSGRYREVKP